MNLERKIMSSSERYVILATPYLMEGDEENP
jgi:hypothetical protein